jgi:hypothetical protein
MTHDDIRHGTTTLFAALNVLACLSGGRGDELSIAQSGRPSNQRNSVQSQDAGFRK